MLGHKACLDDRSVLYRRVPKLFADLALARGDGRHARLLRTLGRADLLILDDFGLTVVDADARQDLLEILEDPYGSRSTIVTCQLRIERWHDVIGDPTYADAILDRLVHNAHRIATHPVSPTCSASGPDIATDLFPPRTTVSQKSIFRRSSQGGLHPTDTAFPLHSYFQMSTRSAIASASSTSMPR